MALTVEDGTGVAGADAYVSLEDCTAYANAHELNDWLNATADQDAAIRRATAFLDRTYTWKGYKTWGRSQTLAWPRVEVLDEEDNEILGTEIPIEIVQATCELAAYEAANPGALTPAVTATSFVTRERVGDIEVNYAVAGGSAEAMRPTLIGVEDLISGLLARGRSTSLTGYALRV